MTTASSSAAAPYQSGLPNLAPANSFSPAAARDNAPLTSSFHVGSTSIAADSPPQSQYGGQRYSTDSRYHQHSSPIQHHQTIYHESPANGVSQSPIMAPPTRPKPPIEQFRDHMRPQLVADSYPAEQIEDRINAEWIKLSHENRGLWEQRYEEQMMDYRAQMEQYKPARRREQQESGESRSGFTTLASRL